ncbi:MAG: hypothetical protein ACI9U2_000104 [Bradymonadia bacterium]
MAGDLASGDLVAGDLRLVPLDQGRFGGVHVLSIDAEARAQIAILDVIWDCRPQPGEVAHAMAAMQLRVPLARLAVTEPSGATRPVTTLRSTAMVDAPLTAVIAGLIATAL